MMRKARKSAARFLVGYGTILAASVFLCLSSASALPLNLQLAKSPDIYSGFINVSYNATTDQLLADGYALTLDYNGSNPAEYIYNGSFNISAIIDDTGNFSSGQLNILGTVPALGFNSNTLLTGTLTSFGFSAGDPLEFIFSNINGDAQGLYRNLPVGVILSQTGFSGDFTRSWNSQPYTSVADTAPTPEPATILQIVSICGMFPIYKCFWKKNS